MPEVRLEEVRCEHHTLISSFDSNPHRVKMHKDRLVHIEVPLARLVRLEARVRALSDKYGYTRAAFHFLPSMQRDHRLRRLLQAFTPENRERLSESSNSLSSLPPLRAPDLFELWGAVAIASALRDSGWIGEAPSVGAPNDEWGVGVVNSCKWTLSRGEESIVFEFAPVIESLQAKQLPHVHSRRDKAIVWGKEQLTQTNVVFTLASKTPDYVIRWSCKEERALLVGDASLADPGFQEGAKIEKIVTYRSLLAWYADNGQIIECNRFGAAFALLPGPRRIWSATRVEEMAAVRDCYVLLPEPGDQGHEDLRIPLAHLIDSLRTS